MDLRIALENAQIARATKQRRIQTINQQIAELQVQAAQTAREIAVLDGRIELLGELLQQDGKEQGDDGGAEETSP